MKRLFILGLILTFTFPAIAQNALAQKKRRQLRGKIQPVAETLGGVKARVYKKVGDVELKMFVFLPKDHKATDKRPAVVFFFGGGWSGGTPKQFVPHCQYLASRGMVAMTAEYRVARRHNVKAIACVTDAKSAIRWTRENADQLGIDKDRIVSSGGSAGGHLAACTGVITGFEEQGEKNVISSRPNAMVLFNPAVVTAPVEGMKELRNAKMIESRMGVKGDLLSPYHHVEKGEPPTLIIHGKGDTTVPFWTVVQFTKKMKAAGNQCQLIGYQGEKHGFFNYGRNDNKNFYATTEEMDKFLVSLGYLKGKPSVREFTFVN